MSTGNLFLGTARRKLGDVVMYRRNGQQQARVRVRTIANPKTEGQALQRNYMAPVSKFYAPLAGVLERSWEGLDKSKSLSQFMKENVQLARSKGWYVLKGAGFTPLPYKLSKGIMDPFVYEQKSAAGGLKWNILGMASGADALKISNISAKLVAQGYSYGDQVTLIFFIGSEDTNDVRPAWCRFLLSETDLTELSSVLPFAVDCSAGTGKIEFTGDVDVPLIGGAVIASRWDGSKWLRSTQYAVMCDDYMENFTSLEARANAISSYQGGSQVVSSDVYLNGGTGSEGSASLDGILLDYYDKTGATRVGALRLYEVVSGSVGPGPVLLRGRRVANGANEIVEVQMAIPAHEDFGKFLDGQGTWTLETNSWDATIKLADVNSELATWLAANGINFSV